VGDPVPSSAISDATAGGLSVIIITGGSDGDVLTQQSDGTYAPETPSAGGSPGGSSGQVQYNNAGAFAGAVAVVYVGSGTHLTVTAQSSSAIPLCVKGAASQTGNLFEARTSANVLGGRLTAAGRFSDNPAGVDSGERFGADSVTTDDSVAFGTRATSNVIAGTAIGKSSYAGHTCTSLGKWAGAASTSGGSPSSHGFTNCIVIADGGDFYAPTASLQMLIAGAFNEVYIGKGVTQASPTASVRLQGSGASGTNIAGTTIRWAPGRSTGIATPASLILQRTVAGSSGTTAQTLSDAVQIDGNVTAGETPLLLLDIDKGTLQRVSIGAADSGGTGFKVLRVPN
jgi:hypothetical protein